MSQAKNEVVRARVDAELKHSSEQVLNSIGMSMTEAIRLFLTQVSLRQEFPVELKVPNKTTLKAMSEALTDTNYESVDALFDEVLNDSQH